MVPAKVMIPPAAQVDCTAEIRDELKAAAGRHFEDPQRERDAEHDIALDLAGALVTCNRRRAGLITSIEEAGK